MQERDMVPVTILTGFLGSGKTTLLNRILKEDHGHRIAVIENEFGEIGVDNEIIETGDEQIVEMNNGCICCTVRGDLIRILGSLKEKRDEGKLNFDRVVIETTGMADPGPVAQTFFTDEEIGNYYLLDSIITRLERERGIRPGTVEIGANIETATGVAAAYDIASASPRVREFGGGTGYDMSRDLGVEMFVGFEQFAYGKGELELAARALGLQVRAAPFVANTTGSVSDADRAFREAQAARKCGFRLGGGLNPAVVEPQNRGFTPTAEEVEDARWVLERHQELAGTGETWIAIDGRVIDRYEAARARDTLEWAALCAERDRDKAEAVLRTRAAMAEPA